ncbi:MAG: hypothetical protein OXC28_20895 [Defluviicoccus sp.]|nr:hypothetical protein [Defluviicoccus sp.]
MKHAPKRGSRTTAVAVLFSMALAAATLSAPNEAMSQTRPVEIPILVIRDDGDRSSVKRSSQLSEIFMSELNGQLKRSWFRPIDEVEAAARLGLDVGDRLTRNQLLQLLRNIRESGRFSEVRAVVLLRLRVAVRRIGTSANLAVAIEGEVRDFLSYEFVNDFAIPPRRYAAPPDCGAPCISQLVSGAAPVLAAFTARILARQLAPYRDGSVTRAYTVTLRDFVRAEMDAIVGVMAAEFPGYKNHRRFGTGPGIGRYSYVSSAGPGKLEEWLTILLGDMGFAVDRDVQILIDGVEVTVEKTAATRR